MIRLDAHFHRLIQYARERRLVSYVWRHYFWVPVKYWFQRRLWGFDDYDTYSMDSHLAELILPRLKRFRFKTSTKAHPICDDIKNMDDWLKILDEMIEGFELIVNGAQYDIFGPNQEQHPSYIKMQRALDLFREYYFDLWW